MKEATKHILDLQKEFLEKSALLGKKLTLQQCYIPGQYLEVTSSQSPCWWPVMSIGNVVVAYEFGNPKWLLSVVWKGVSFQQGYIIVGWVGGHLSMCASTIKLIYLTSQFVSSSAPSDVLQ